MRILKAILKAILVAICWTFDFILGLRERTYRAGRGLR
jgi:hypothetical protein